VQQTARTLDAAMKLSGRQRSGELLKTMAEVMELAEQAGEPPMSPEQLVSAADRLESTRISGLVKRAVADPAWRAKNAAVLKDLAQAIMPALEGDSLLDFFGPKNVDRLARAALAKYRKNPLPQVASQTPQTPPAASPQQRQGDSESMYGAIDRMTR
jgi:hypothetical protein